MTSEEERRCLGRTKNLRRCGRYGRRFFCDDHRWQPLVWFGFLIFTVGPVFYLYLGLLRPLLFQADVPRLAFSLWKTLYDYTPGLEVEGVIWREPYREYIFTIRNSNKTESVVDLRLRFEFPWPVIASRLTHQMGSEDVVLSRDAEPLKVGSGRRITKFAATLTNVLSINARTLSPEAYFGARFILTTEGVSAERGLFHVTYRHKPTGGSEIKKSYLHQITVLDAKTGEVRIEPTPLKGKLEGTIIFRPVEPIQLRPQKPADYQRD